MTQSDPQQISSPLQFFREKQGLTPEGLADLVNAILPSAEPRFTVGYAIALERGLMLAHEGHPAYFAEALGVSETSLGIKSAPLDSLPGTEWYKIKAPSVQVTHQLLLTF